ncbi:MAG: hypothetical protein ACE5JU_10025 [Candidatus Binatia bacterium]
MQQNADFKGSQSRRKFLGGFLAGVGGAAAWLLVPKRARAAGEKPTVRAIGPILYRRTREAERYYKTLYL